MTLADIKAKLAPFFDKNQDVLALYLFGSVAEGTANAASDLDFGVLLKRNQESSYYAEARLDLTAQLLTLFKRDDIDLVILNTSTSRALRFSIVTDGLVLFERYPDLCQYELNLRREYFDHIAAIKRAGF